MTEKKPICIVNALSLIPPLSGVGRVTLELCRRIFAEEGANAENARFHLPYQPYFYYGYYSKHLMDADAESQRTNDKSRGIVQHAAGLVRSNPFLKRCVRRAMREFNKISAHGARDAALYWEPNHVVLPEIAARRVVVTVHDLSCMLHRQWHPKERLDFFDRYFFKGLERADRIVTVSETVKGELIEHCGIPSEKITAIHNGVDTDLFRPPLQEEIAAFRKRRNLPERYVLYVGSLEPRKNLTNLLKAWMLEPEKRKRAEAKLLLISNAGWQNKEILEMICKGEEMGVIERRTDVPTAELPYYYNCAELFAYLSFYEGFGLPPVEALCCGTPVLASDIPVHREVLGERSGVTYVGPEDVAGIGEKIDDALSAETKKIDRSNALQSIGKQYSWDDKAAAYDRVLAE